MTDRLAEFMGKVMDAIAAGLKESGEDEVSHIRDDIGVPVEYAAGGVIRSAPGEPPRRETGELWNSIKSAVEKQPDRVTLQMAAGPALDEHGNDYAAGLEVGSGHVAERPYMGPSMSRMEVAGIFNVVEHLKQVK
jgi:hypothetical protein